MEGWQQFIVIGVRSKKLMRTVHLGTVLMSALFLSACSHNQDYTARQFGLVSEQTSERVAGAVVTREFFSNAGVRPYLGRLFIDSEFRPNRSVAAVLSYGIWQRLFHKRPEVIGSKIELDNRLAVIVGIAEPDFEPRGAGEIWIPNS